MHTEEEAKKLWCPHVRLVQGRRLRKNDDIELRPPSHNRVKVYGESEGIVLSSCCVASQCSQWRWREEMAEATDQTMQFHSMRDRTPDDPGFVWRVMMGDDDALKWVKCKILPSKGYCGLAGKP